MENICSTVTDRNQCLRQEPHIDKEKKSLWARAAEHLKGEVQWVLSPGHLQASGLREGGFTTTIPLLYCVCLAALALKRRLRAAGYLPVHFLHSAICSGLDSAFTWTVVLSHRAFCAVYFSTSQLLPILSAFVCLNEVVVLIFESCVHWE